MEAQMQNTEQKTGRSGTLMAVILAFLFVALVLVLFTPGARGATRKEKKAAKKVAAAAIVKKKKAKNPAPKPTAKPEPKTPGSLLDITKDGKFVFHAKKEVVVRALLLQLQKLRDEKAFFILQTDDLHKRLARKYQEVEACKQK